MTLSIDPSFDFPFDSDQSRKTLIDPDDAFILEQDKRWIEAYIVTRRHSVIVDPNLKGHWIVFKELSDRLDIISLDVHRENPNVIVVVVMMNCFDLGHRDEARLAPCRPKIYQRKSTTFRPALKRDSVAAL